MTVIVSVKINDGVIMAADSASTFGNGQIYLTADKMVNLVKGLPIGVMATGNGGIGAESLATLLKDLRRRLSGNGGPQWSEWTLVPAEYTMVEVASRVREFLFEKAQQQTHDNFIRLRICGYSSGRRCLRFGKWRSTAGLIASLQHKSRARVMSELDGTESTMR